MTDDNAQVSAEFLFVFGILIIVVMIAIVFAAGEHELNLAMSAARNGAVEGLSTSSCAIYPISTFKEYETAKSNLLIPYSVFKVYAKTSDRFSNDELVSIGDRINYNLRKSIAISFNSTQATNKLYNPVFSPHYVYTTANVRWV